MKRFGEGFWKFGVDFVRVKDHWKGSRDVICELHMEERSVRLGSIGEGGRAVSDTIGETRKWVEQ